MGIFDNFNLGGGNGIIDVPPSNAWQGGQNFPSWLAEYLKTKFQNAPQIPTGQPQTTNTARPDILAPMTQTQPSQMSQPQRPQGPWPQALDLGGTIGPALDPGAGQQFPANSQPTQGQAPEPQYGGQPALNPGDMGILPGIFGHLQAAGSNFTSGGNPIAGTINALGGLLTGQRTDPFGVKQQMAMAQYHQLLQDGIPPGKALAMIQSPQILQNYYDRRSLGEVKLPGGTGVPLINEQNQMSLGVPGGGSLSDLAQAGNEFTRQHAASEKLGEAQGTSQGGLPNTLALFDKGISDIDNLIKDPALKQATGITGAVMQHIPGSPAQRALAKIKELSGEASIAGISYLKGIGRLNINEFNAGSNAIGRLQHAQSYQDYVSALQDLRKTFALSRERAGQTAGVGPTPPQTNALPTYTQEDLLGEARRRGLIQ